ncbi:hypothetical protein H6CHR_01008 [Variovorax sp. PBL-H6]|uniref:cupin-like domain-containing protein n=1 Tax=Variovorax sp. PBL-H6 TaxID=434009 RepID=UPI001319B64E|nr:cupin-like domain-containing protein [Variovorax sp. PBL-H6]VTU18574.1 hypothetical protein H6CHR_01008 [Variovorax sp. PBL-H6]
MLRSPGRNEGARPSPSTGLIDLTDREPWSNLNKNAFAFRHNLQGHPLFTIQKLAELSKHVFDWPDYQRYFPFDQRSLPTSELKRILRDSILDVANNGRWLALHQIDMVAPEYAELLDQLFADIEELTGTPIRSRMAWGSMSIFMNAPGLSVPYHFDHETNFLMQIEGEKEARLYPPALQTLTIEEIEDFYRHNPIAARYRDELATAGTVFTLTPGIAVHHPPLAAHKIQNGNSVSVSLSIYYTTPDMEDRARVHQANYCMRKLGLKPRPIDESTFWDGAKAKFMRTLSKSNPKTHDEMLYSGVERLGAPFRWAKALKQRTRQPSIPV